MREVYVKVLHARHDQKPFETFESEALYNN